MSGRLRFVLALLLASGSLQANAFRPKNVSPGEIALLPPYCIDTEGFIYGPENSPNMSPRAHEWVQKMGHSFWSLHHYCWGLVNLNRLRNGRAETTNKQYFALQIVDEYNYVLRNSTSDFVLLPEIWTRVGEASLLAGDAGTALSAYENARRIKPDYWPAYTQWAEFLIGKNMRAEAMDLVKTGLQQIPGNPQLVALYGRLGGSPAAVARASSPPASAASGSSTHSSN